LSEKNHLLDIQRLKTYFYTLEGTARAVQDVSFFMDEGETVGLVGESGCGKSVSALSVMRLIKYPPGKIVDGQIFFEGSDLLKLSERQMRSVRGARISMIFQEPMTSLNPVYTIGHQISEMFMIHKRVSKKEGRQRAVETLRQVQMPSPRKRVDEYPHQLSGGMRQRTMIAMAMACNPKILIADEPTTALDVTIQAQILKLLKDLQKEFDSAIILVTHDLASVAQICQRVLVMYAGRIVEKAPIKTFFKNPAHPYSIGLIKSLPKLGQKVDQLYSIEGQPPSLFDLPRGCRFAPRCENAKAICSESYPPEVQIAEGHNVSCWLFDEEDR